MKEVSATQSDRKHKAMVDAARSLFLKQGYDGTSMEEIAVKAAVSKQTVYKHFADKKRLFEEIVLATTSQVDRVVGLVAGPLVETLDLKKDLTLLGRQFIAALMDPRLLRLRRLIIANADRMPELGRTWYEQGFERVLGTLATSFAALSKRRLLSLEDPLLAAHHFVGLLLWIPVNQAMFTGNDEPYTKAELDRYADAAVNAFLAAYSARANVAVKSPR
ncbi:MAG: TetR/AcrR family transcriptional regulator [Steroidobacteraceae bacterium]|jgi:TetR/AcrR family transcriptional repressor of mexJK operon